MSETPARGRSDRWDATNAVRLCDRCELEQGVSAGADAKDRACSSCGQHHAPNVYVGLAEYERLEAIVRHVAGLVDPVNLGNEYGLVHRTLIYDAREALNDA